MVHGRAHCVVVSMICVLFLRAFGIATAQTQTQGVGSLSSERAVGLVARTDWVTTSDAQARRWLFLVAVDKYQHPEFLTPLQNCVNDAVAFRDMLRARYGFTSIVELFNEKATRSEIEAKLDELAGHVSPEDHVIVFFSGHGNLNEKTQIGYWYPAEAGRATDGLSNSVVKDYCAALKARHVLIVADCCFAGSLLVRSAPVPEESGRRSREVIVSGNLTPVADSGTIPDARGHSVFAYYLLKTLDEKAQVGAEFNSNDLYVHLFSAVKTNSSQEPQKGVLQVAGHEGGTFHFCPGGFWPASASSKLDTMAEKARETDRLLERARTAFDRAEEIERREAAPPSLKVKAWEACLAECQPAGHRVTEVRARIEKWHHLEQQPPRVARVQLVPMPCTLRCWDAGRHGDLLIHYDDGSSRTITDGFACQVRVSPDKRTVGWLSGEHWVDRPKTVNTRVVAKSRLILERDGKEICRISPRKAFSVYWDFYQDDSVVVVRSAGTHGQEYYDAYFTRFAGSGEPFLSLSSSQMSPSSPPWTRQLDKLYEEDLKYLKRD